MNYKSVPAFVLGLIGGVLALIGGLMYVACADVLAALGGEDYTVMVFIFFILGAVLTLLGSVLCLKKANLIAPLVMALGAILEIVGLVIVGTSWMIIIGVVLTAIGIVVAFLTKREA